MSWRNRDTISQNLFARWFIADVSIYWLSAIDELQWDFSFHFRFEWGAYLPNVVVRSQRSYFALITLSFHWFTQCLFFRENQRTIIICRIVYVNRKCVCVCFFFFVLHFIHLHTWNPCDCPASTKHTSIWTQKNKYTEKTQIRKENAEKCFSGFTHNRIRRRRRR